MTRRANAHLLAVLCTGTAALALPALSAASSGGGGVGPGGPAPSQSSQPGDGTVTASNDGMTIATRASSFLNGQLRFSGNVPARYAGRTIEIELSGQKTNWAWRPAAQSQVQSNGSFAVVWQTNHIGRFAARAVLSQPTQAQNGAASTSAAWPTVTLTVYRPSIASWYGGAGVWGSKTACGEVLRRQTLGVANRTLPCGTPVALYYRGRTITVPVIDRGPYANHADWDLTEATAQALGMDGVVTLGAVSLPRRG